MTEPHVPALLPPSMAVVNRVSPIVPRNVDETIRLAEVLSRSGDMIPRDYRGNPPAIAAAIIRGMEIGLSPMQALASIAVVNGRPSLWGDALPALVLRAGHHIDDELVGEGENMKAVATLTRSDGSIFVREFSVTDAKRAGLWGKSGPWTQYWQRMLRMRARSWAVRDGAPDAILGFTIAEEAADVADDTGRQTQEEYLAPPDAGMVGRGGGRQALEEDLVCLLPPKGSAEKAPPAPAQSPHPAEKPAPRPAEAAHNAPLSILPPDVPDDLPLVPKSNAKPQLIHPDGTVSGPAKGALASWTTAWRHEVEATDNIDATLIEFVRAFESARALYPKGDAAEIISELAGWIQERVDVIRTEAAERRAEGEIM